MKRRDFIAGGCAVSLLGGTGVVVADEPVLPPVKDDKYWENQWLISELEEELSEMRTHARIMSKRT